MIRMAIRRPVAVSMLYICIAVLGVAAWRNVPIELLPDSSLPQLVVSASWQGGGSAEVMEAFLTAPVEGVIQQIGSVERVTSNSEQNRATITVQFARGTDMNLVRLELSERLAVVRRDLPQDVRFDITQSEPAVFARQRRPFLSYDVTGPYTLEYLAERTDSVIASELRQIMGVADVQVSGGRTRLLEVVLDEQKINSLGLSPQQVGRAIGSLEQVRQLGVVWDGGTLRSVTVRERPEGIDDILNALVLVDRGRLVRVRDVADIHVTFADPTSYYRINGFPSAGFTVTRAPGTNLVAVSHQVKAKVAELEALMPPGVRLIKRSDESIAVREQLTDLRTRAIFSAIVIFVVLLISLRSFRSSGIVFATIAFSMLFALNLVYWGGYSLNVLTLMGIAMGFGLIVDNAIVVLENVYRRKRLGEPAEVAAEQGSRDVVLPILAATFTTVIVLIPFVYLQGELRVYYVPLALVVGFSLIASLFVAFTFIPAVAARLLRHDARAAFVTLDAAADGATAPGAGEGAAAANAASAVGGSRPGIHIRLYAALVGATLRFPWVTVVVAAMTLAGSYYLFDNYVTRNTLWGGTPRQRSNIDIQIRQPRNTELESTDAIVRFFEEKIAQMPEVEDFVARVNPEAATINITFPDSVATTIIPTVIHEQMYAYSHQFGGTDVRVYGPSQAFYGGGGAVPNYRIQVLGYNYEKVREIAEDVASRLSYISRVRDIDTNATGTSLRDRATEIVARIDRSRLALHGLAATDLVNRIRAAIQGAPTQAGYVRLEGDELRMEVKLEGNRTLDVKELPDLILPTPRGGAVRLGDLVTIEERYVLSSVRRENQQYERTVAYEFRGPPRLGDLWRDTIIHYTELPPGYTVIGRRENVFTTEQQRQIWSVLIVSIVLIFMVTAAFFESVRQPLCVLLAVPMALVGVFLLFFYLGAQFNREAYIGVIMMGGIVVNNAILLVHRVNQLRREEGMALEPAVLRGTLDRVRPILMTSATTVIGMLPLVLFSETVNANIWNALAYPLIGGLISSTLFVLTVTPALYLLFERPTERRRLARLARASAA